MKEKYGKICGRCGRLYRGHDVPPFCECCGQQLIYKNIDKVGIRIYEPTVVPVTYHRTWCGKLIITPQENWAKQFQEAIKNE